MRESAQKPFKSIASHLLEHREVAEYDILIEVFVWFWYIFKHENGKRRKLELPPDILIEVFVRFVGAHLDDDVLLSC